MNTPKFTPVTIAPNTLTAHDLLTGMGHNHKADKFYTDMIKEFGHYEHPVIDRNNRVITHHAEVEAAVANGVKEMEVYQVDMDDLQLRLFIAMKHKYHIKDTVAVYRSIQFYEDYLVNHPEGITLSERLGGRMSEKIAQLLHTSDSTVKRIKRIGEYKLHWLGLIENGELGMKEAIDRIKEETMIGHMQQRKEARELQTHFPGQEAGNGPDNRYDQVTLPDPGIQQDHTVQVMTIEKQASGQEGGVAGSAAKSTVRPLCDLSVPDFYIQGFGGLEVRMNRNIPLVSINGKELSDLSFEQITNRDSAETGIARSFVIRQNSKHGIKISLTVDLPKAA